MPIPPLAPPPTGGFVTRRVSVVIGDHTYDLLALSDKQQFADPNGAAEAAGVAPAHWSLFGQLWPAGRVLAEAMHRIAAPRRRTLELGCGLALASLVMARRGFDVVASDHHPLAEPFLLHNAGHNGIVSPTFRDLRWNVPDLTLGRFDLIIASDVLYERDHAELLALVVERHAEAHADVLVTDPGRGNSAAFQRRMTLLGFEMTEERSPFNESDVPPYRGRLLHFQR